jgi:fluoride exporter
MLKWILIAVGGGLGSVLRYAVQVGVSRLWNHAFPLGTLLVNLTGCILIGLLIGLFYGAATIREEYRLALTVGVLGGFTTFSTFGLESFNLLMERRLGTALFYVVVSCIAGIVAVWLGWRLGDAVR